MYCKTAEYVKWRWVLLFDVQELPPHQYLNNQPPAESDMSIWLVYFLSN